jgi:hypothetical protein
LELAVEAGDADAVGSQHVGVCAWQALDEAVQAQTPEVVAHPALAVVVGEVGGDERAQGLVGEAGDGVELVAERAGQGHDACVPEAQRSGSLALTVVGQVDALKERRADGTALAGAFDDKQPVVDLAGLGDELGKVLEAAADVEIGLGRDERSFYEPWGPFFIEEHLRGNRPGDLSPFAQYLVYAPLVPFESSPLTAKALSDLAAAGGGIGAAVGAYATGDPLLLLAVPAGIVVCGAAHGLADALRIGLRAKLLQLMGVADPAADRSDSEPPSS